MKMSLFQGGNVLPISAPGAQNGIVGGVQFAPGMQQDSLVYPQELTHLTEKARPLYRPNKWRGIIDVESVPTYAETVEDRKYEHLVEDPVNLTGKAPTQELPMPSVSTSNQFLPLFMFGLAYGVFDRDLEMAARVGVPLATEHLVACNMGFEFFLEGVASVGHTATGMKGLGNLADVTAVTAVTKAAGGTTWAVATTAEIVQDLHALCNQVVISSKENDVCDTIVLPLAQYQRATQVITDSLERTALERFRAERPEVRNIHIWNRLSNQGAGSTPAMMGWSSTSPYRPRMLMQQEVSYGQPLRGINGWVIPGMISTGGVRCKNPESVAKMSAL